MEGHVSNIHKGYIEIKLFSNKQSVVEVLIQRAVETTIQINYDKWLVDNYCKTDEGLQDFLLKDVDLI